jgi:predicted nucleic acid-binding protein
MTNSVFIDTNVLVHAHLARSPLFPVATGQIRQLENEGAELWISRQVLREYLSVMTRGDLLSTPIPASLLVADVHDMAEQFRIAEDDAQVTEQLLVLLQQVAVGGKQIHDANIVATMLSGGIARLLTQNVSDFRRFAHLVEVIPLASESE